MIKKPPLFATLTAFAAFTVLCALGTWQTQRLYWKRQMLTDLRAAYATASPPVLSGEDLADFAAGTMPFARARVQGRYIHDDTITIGPRTWQGANGYHILTPLRLEDGIVLVINRGWVAAADKNAVQRPANTVTVTGLLRRPERYNPFVPANDPASGQWYRIDPAQIADHFGLGPIIPVILYAGEESGGTALPVREALRWMPPDNHFQYAVFWFGMAGILAVIFWLRFVRQP